jgi:thymidylate kinase
VHAHRRLVFGDDMTKNFALDIEDDYIASATRESGTLAVASPDHELLLFAFRMVAKHCTIDAMLMRQGRLSASERRELAWLTARADRVRIAAIVASRLPFVDPDLFDECLGAIQPGAGPWRKARTAGRLHRTFAAHAKRGRFADAFLRIERRFGRLGRRLVRGRARKRLAGGGALIAFVGGDGAGKSTAVRTIAGWLSGPFQVERIHLGKPPPSLTTIAIKGPMYLLRAMGMFRATRVPAHELRERGTYPGMSWVLWHVLTARDRFRLYRRATRAILKGEVVLSDRFPLAEVQTMDGAKTDWVTGHARAGRVVRWLVSLERRYYSAFTSPDVLIVLRVDPNVAVERKRHEEQPGFVLPRRRSGAWTGAGHPPGSWIPAETSRRSSERSRRSSGTGCDRPARAAAIVHRGALRASGRGEDLARLGARPGGGFPHHLDAHAGHRARGSRGASALAQARSRGCGIDPSARSRGDDGPSDLAIRAARPGRHRLALGPMGLRPGVDEPGSADTRRAPVRRRGDPGALVPRAPR